MKLRIIVAAALLSVLLFLIACNIVHEEDRLYFDLEQLHQIEYDDEEYPAFEPIVITSTMRIHPDMPEFTFLRIIGDYKAIQDFGNERYVSIMIMDENGGLVQEIGGLWQGGHGGFVAEDEWFNIRFVDSNFDGYLDIHLIQSVNPGTAGGEWGYHFLWEPESGQFVRNMQLEYIDGGMSLFYANQETRQIIIRNRLWVAHFLYEFYEYREGEFVLVALREYDNFDFNDYWTITVTDALTGEVTIETAPF